MDGDRTAAGHNRCCSPKEAGCVANLEGFARALLPLLADQNRSSRWVSGSRGRGTAGSVGDIDPIVVAPSERLVGESSALGAHREAGD